MNSNKHPVLGVDIGGVIISRSNDKSDTSFFGGNFLNSKAVEFAFEAIASAVDAGYTTCLVSKCGEEVQRKTLLWLAHHEFYDRTGVLPEQVRFCRTRPEKAQICDELEVTHFVDDRLEVLSYLVNVPNLYLFDGQPKEMSKFAAMLPNVHQTRSWAELSDLLGRSITTSVS
ncbi:MAG: hypothetical protein K2W95_16390 [Candidatus Obscuribacterales bacterium]|nr:hypothetical protein [Candidatus Obscuribacterales bacterium]